MRIAAFDVHVVVVAVIVAVVNNYSFFLRILTCCFLDFFAVTCSVSVPLSSTDHSHLNPAHPHARSHAHSHAHTVNEHTQPIAFLKLDIIEARGLHPMDLNGKSDPYVLVEVEPRPSDTCIFKSTTKFKTLDPVYHETCLLPVCLL